MKRQDLIIEIMAWLITILLGIMIVTTAIAILE
jgi:hypothetical protein